nr:retrovirus-related Pol polyprotein from transposon TNT 1-94 [Tanacetum cinerariifolium]
MDGIVHTYKAHLVAKGYTQIYGVDYKETFSPVADIRAIRILISIAAFYDYEIWQMDVKTAFLNGYIDEDIYMVQPKGFVDHNHPRKVCKLQRSIYGLKQASRSWNKRFDKEIKRFGFAQNLDEPCVYQKASGSNVTFLILYVDDITIMGNHIPSLQSVKDYLGKCFAMKDLRKAAFILGIKIYRDWSKRLIGLGQNAYKDKIIKRYKMDNSKRGHIHIDDTKSQTGYVFILNGDAMDWKSSKQITTAMSAIEAEYIAAMEAIWIRKFISGLGVQKGTRHYHMRYHYVHESIALGKIRFLKVHTYDNLADPFTKALIASVAIVDRQLPFEYTITSRSTDMVVPIPPAPAADSEGNVLAAWNALYDVHNEVACLMLGSMTPELHRQFKNYSPYEML